MAAGPYSAMDFSSNIAFNKFNYERRRGGFGKTFLSHDRQYLNKGENAVNFSFAKREVIILAIVLAIAFLVRVLLFPLQGYPIDTNDFISWFTTAADHGIRPFYTVAGYFDYPPFNVYIFWAFGSLANALGIGMANMIKFVPNLFDLATTGLIYIFVRKQATFKVALVSMVLYAFNPAVIYNAAVWGQFDAVYTFFLILSLMLALKSRPIPSAVIFAIGLLTKPQGIALLPLIVLLIYKKNGLKQLLYSVVAFASTVFLVVLPFEGIGNPITFLIKNYSTGYLYYNVTSVNAFNLWGLFGLWVKDGYLFFVGWALFGAVAAFILYMVHKRFKVSGDLIVIFAAFMLFFAFFMLPTRIHERYMFPAISVLALMFPLLKKARALYAVLTATFLINQAYVLYWLNFSYPNAGPNLTGDPVVLAVSIINLVMLLYVSVLMWDELKGRQWLKNEPVTLNHTQQRGEPKLTAD
jgi:dolichyl-phosphate-mannose-protein mannosyltransferase